MAAPADGESSRARRRPDPIRHREPPTEEPRPEMSIEYAQPGSAQDARLRRDRAKAVLAIIKSAFRVIKSPICLT